MSAQHIAAAAIVVDLAREKAIRDALDAFLAAADALARAAGVDYLSVSLGSQESIHEVVVRAGWHNHINPCHASKPGLGFGVARKFGEVADVDVFGGYVPLEQPSLDPVVEVANPIVIRPLGVAL